MQANDFEPLLKVYLAKDLASVSFDLFKIVVYLSNK